MSTRKPYQLLDFGGGRRLERFGDVALDRPCPAAESYTISDPDAWAQADARFELADAQRGRWTLRRELPDRWFVDFGQLRFELKRTEFGHLGLFPEQAENWDWIANNLPSPFGRGAEGEGIRPSLSSPHPRPPSPTNASRRRPERGDALKILNLFAYTGGSTLAAARAGAEVVHVDAAKNVVAWARRNAELSGLAAAPIRWIAEDAQKFVKRELRRGVQYDAVILDPPSYGHGPRGEVWRLSKHLPRLLSLCAELTSGRLRFMLLTCHTPGFEADVLKDMIAEAFGRSGNMTSQPLTIRSTDRRLLPSGAAVRFLPNPVSRIPNPDSSSHAAHHQS